MASDLQTSNSISFKEHDSPTDQEGCPSISNWDDSQEPDINSVESQPNSCESETDHERPGNEPNGQGADPGKYGNEPQPELPAGILSGLRPVTLRDCKMHSSQTSWREGVMQWW